MKIPGPQRVAGREFVSLGEIFGTSALAQVFTCISRFPPAGKASGTESPQTCMRIDIRCRYRADIPAHHNPALESHTSGGISRITFLSFILPSDFKVYRIPSFTRITARQSGIARTGMIANRSPWRSACLVSSGGLNSSRLLLFCVEIYAATLPPRHDNNAMVTSRISSGLDGCSNRMPLHAYTYH